MDLMSLLMLLVGTGLFMVAGFAVCFVLMIFCDILNLGGGFEKITGPIIALAFVPFLLAARMFDSVAHQFVRAEIRKSLRPAVPFGDRTVKV